MPVRYAMTDHNLEVKAVAATFVSIACVTVLLRCYVRLRVVRSFGWDDGAMVIAMLFYFMFSGSMIGGSLYGTGRHHSDLTAHQRVTAMEVSRDPIIPSILRLWYTRPNI